MRLLTIIILSFALSFSALGQGDDCSDAQDLASLVSPYSATTTGYSNDFTFCTMSSSADRIFYIDVDNGCSVEIWQSVNAYDSRHTMRYGGACPGTTEIGCIDDSDYTPISWTNNTGSTERVYWINAGYSSNEGTFTLNWTLTCCEEPATVTGSPSASSVAPGTNVTFDYDSHTGGACAAGNWEYQWEDDLGNVLQAWSTTSSYSEVLNANVIYYLFMRCSACSATLTQSNAVSVSVIVGDNCSSAQDLSALTSPYNGTTVGYADDISVCQTGYPDRVFYIDVDDGCSIDIWQSTNSYDSYHYMGYGNSCPGATQLYCVDDSDIQHNTWTNNTGSTQTVWFVVDGYSGSGTFTLEWTLACCEAPTSIVASASSASVYEGDNVTYDYVSHLGGACASGNWEYQWEDDLGNVLQAWSTTSSYIENMSTAGAYTYYLYMRCSDCTGSVTQSNAVSVTVLAICPTTINTYPYTESFESDFGDWVQETTDDYDWTRLSGATGSTSTGPTTASDGTYYAYTEASAQLNSEFILNGPCFDLTCSNPMFTVDYHMYGSTMGSLDLEIEATPGSGVWISLGSISGNQGDVWSTATIDLTAYSGTTVKLRFRGVTGSDYYSDMAIDNIEIYCACAPPTDPGNPTASVNTCGDKDLSFVGSPGAGITWYWQTTTEGTDMTNSTSPYSASVSGTYYLRAYLTATTCWSLGEGSVTVDVEQTPATPSINDTTVCPGDVTLQAYGSGACAEYMWYDASSGGTLLNTGTLYDVNVPATTSFYVEASSAGSFEVTPGMTNSYVVDHFTVTGDDRAGIAITQDYLYVVGDVNTARMDLPLTLLTATLLPVKDGLFSDLSTGNLWTIYDGTAEPSGTAITGYNVNSLKQYDDNLTFNGTTLILSSSFTVGDEGGIYAGKGFVIIQDGDTDNFYHIDLSSGVVTGLGIITTPSRSFGENWATWGIAEYDGCSYYVLYTDNINDDIVRLDLTTGIETIASDLTNISDMVSITVSPWENRWYFHHEGSSEFGGTDETCGYADATISSTVGGNCTSARDEVVVSTLAAASAPNISAFPAAVVAGDPSTLTGGYSGGTLTWYDGDCEGVVLGTGSSIVVNPVLTTTYYAAVDNGACVSECDTVTVIVAQPCDVDATADGLYDTLNICAGDAVDIAATGGCSYLMDNDFDGGITGVGWESNASPDFTNPCVAPVDGTTYLWVGDVATFPRDLVTQPYSVSQDCEICFDFVMATQGDATPCEGPDEMDEGVSLQWSIDDGATWTDITYFCPDGSEYPTNAWVGESTSGGGTGTPFNVWDNYCYNVPAAGSSLSTKFRFHQEQVTSNTYDHWGIDNVEITCPSDGQTVLWSYGATELDPVTDVTPGASTTYTVIIDDGLGFGNADTSQVHIHIIGTPDVTDDHACSIGDAVTMLASGSGTLEWYDAATGGSIVNTGATYDIASLAAPDSFYVAEVIPSFTTINYTFDTDEEGWSIQAPCTGSDNWVWNTDGGNGALFAVNPAIASSQVIVSPSIDVSAWSSSLTLSYLHKYLTESCCDHGFVAYRLDGGAWIQFVPGTGSYSGNDTQNNEPLWNSCGISATMSLYFGTAVYDTHSGPIDVSTANTLEIAFVFTSDGSVSSTGWYIDEVSIAGGGAGACPTSRAVVYADISDIHSDDSFVDVSCFGNNDGQVATLAVDASNNPLTGLFAYTWDTGDNTTTVFNMSAGSYDVTILDTYGCDEITTITVGGPVMPTLMVSSSGISGDCNIVSPDEWVHIVNGSDETEVIASVFDAAGGNDLFLTEAEATIYGAVQYYNAQPYLQRVVRVTPSVQGAAIVRVYFTDAEFTALQVADPTILSVNDLSVTKCDDGGVWSNCIIVPSTFAVSPIGTGYYAEVTVTSFSEFFIHKFSTNPLPVELLYFNAHCSNNGVEMNWTTSTETNNDFFVLERSYDMKNFEYVAEISGQGNSNKKTSYSYKDYSYDGRKAYYRLLQVDFDGKSEYHPAILVNCNKEEQESIIAYQVSEHAILLETQVEEGDYTLIIVDNTGKLIVNKSLSIVDENQKFTFENYNLIKGLYYVSLRNGTNKYNQKVMIK